MNKRTMKKGLAIVLALVMVFAMTATAFASSSGVNVSVQMGGTEYFGESVSAADIAGYLEANQTHLYSTDGASSLVPNVGYTAADALIAAWYKFYECSAYDSSQIAYYWDNAPKKGLPGLAFTTYDGLSSEGKYYFVETSTDAQGKTLYWYYWEGDAWNLYIDNIPFKDVQYSTSYGVNSISNVVFDYNTTRSEIFSTSDPIPNAEPAPAA